VQWDLCSTYKKILNIQILIVNVAYHLLINVKKIEIQIEIKSPHILKQIVSYDWKRFIRRSLIRLCFCFLFYAFSKLLYKSNRDEVVCSNNVRSKFKIFFRITFVQKALFLYVLSNNRSFEKTPIFERNSNEK
jgi:hypothetical protein